MADSKLTALGTVTTLADGDLVYVVDVSDTTDDPAGSSKGITKANLMTTLGVATKEYAAFYLSTGGITGVSTAETTLTLNATSVNSNGSVFGLASSQVTVNKTGDFKVSAECYFNTGGSSRSEYSMFLEVDAVEVPGTRSGTYQRGYDSGDTASFSTIISITSGEVFQLRIIRTDGGATTGYQDNNGTRLSFVEL